MKLECPTVFRELMPGKRGRQVEGNPVNPRSGQTLKRNIKELQKSGRCGVHLSQGLGEGSWRKCLGNRVLRKREVGRGEREKHAWGRCRCLCDGRRS